MESVVGNVFLLSMLLWPMVVLLAAGLNMLISWTFSWQELVMGYLIGVVIGLCFYSGTAGPPEEVDAWEHFFLTASIGLFGLLKWLGTGVFQDPETLLWAGAGSVLGATAVCAGTDRFAVQVIGRTSNVGNVLLSVLVFGIKAPFGLFTTAVGTVIGIIGAIVASTQEHGGFGFIGGVFYTQWGLSGRHATTFSSYVNVFRGDVSGLIDHELYHTRQYIYMQDWLGVVYFTIGAVWGWVSSAVSSSGFDARKAFTAAGELGNPLEVAAYKLDWS